MGSKAEASPSRVSPDYSHHLSDVPCPIPRRIEWGGLSIAPRSRGLPRFPGGSASTLPLSRPARTSLKLRPVGSLNRPRRPLSRGSGPEGYPPKPLVSFRSYRLLSGWNLPPLVLRAFGAHWKSLEEKGLDLEMLGKKKAGAGRVGG